MPFKIKEKHDHTTLRFPQGFLWGVATSAHQVEGNNIHSDWWHWEQKLPPHFRSGQACDHYNRFEEDFALAEKLNINAERISIEWARIEPKEGEFDAHEIEHYKQVLRSIKSHHAKVMLTLWHFTLPQWIAEKGGWENSKTTFYFERFVKRIVPELKDDVDFWVTVNEPSIYIFMAYLTGEWPPQKKSKFAALKVFLNLTNAHKRVYEILHTLDNKPVGFAQNVQSFEPYHKHSLFEQIRVILSDLVDNHSFYTFTKKHHDYIGINYYFHHRFKPGGPGLFPSTTKITLDMTHDVSDLGWEVFPEGLFEALIDFDFNLPVYITECGIASTNDDRRTRFLMQYLQEVYRAIQAGVDVRGFFYWSLLDNFEWHRGFEPRFGIISMDYKTQKRTIRPSAEVYSEVIRLNGISHHMLKFLGHTVKTQEVLSYHRNCIYCRKKT